MTDLKLFPRQRIVYDLLSRSGDVSFVDIYVAIGGDQSRVDERDGKGRHYAQSYVSSCLTKLNRRLKKHGQRVIPGRVKRTYCLARAD